MKIPTTLRHKPVIVSENYANVDGRTAYHTDAQGLSLGLAQWNDRGKVDISAKVWRYTGEKWSGSRRNCLCTGCWTWLSLSQKQNSTFQEAYRYPGLYEEEKPQLARIPLQGDAMYGGGLRRQSHDTRRYTPFRGCPFKGRRTFVRADAYFSDLLQEMGYGPWKPGKKKSPSKGI
jgi:hypothetical protein